MTGSESWRESEFVFVRENLNSAPLGDCPLNSYKCNLCTLKTLLMTHQ